MLNLVIQTEDLGKRYGDVRAVDHLSLRVAEGEVYAFLGLNGAGKTTTIRMLLGMIRPTTGSAVVLGARVRPGSREPWAAVGYLVETPHAYGELSHGRYLPYPITGDAARLRGADRPREPGGRAASAAINAY